MLLILDAFDVLKEGSSGFLNTLGSTDLALDLLASPSCSVDGSGLEFTVLSCILNHLGEPVDTVVCGEFAVRESIRKITISSAMFHKGMRGFSYPMTPIDDRMSASLLFWSR